MKILSILQSVWRNSVKKWTERILIRKWFDIGLRAKMSALVTIGLLGLIAIFGFIAISNVRQSTQQLLSEHVLRARILSESLDSNLSHVAGMLTVLSSQIDMDTPQTNLEKWNTIFEKDFNPVQGVYLLDLNNHLLASAAASMDISWKDVPLPKQINSDTTRIISTDGLPRPYAMVTVPVTHLANNQLEGFLTAIIDLSNPDIFISSGSLELEQGGTLQVLDSQGQVLVSTHPDRMLTESTVEKITDQLFSKDTPMFEAGLCDQ